MVSRNIDGKRLQEENDRHAECTHEQTDHHQGPSEPSFPIKAEAKTHVGRERKRKRAGRTKQEVPQKFR